ncbi:NAD-dependent dihydropyrimidine dehydrogenase subunit PreA [Clostridium frigoris]|uniref:dihydrouracil dehydrogenase (NAD(+)) n=1 Tax=Clostridium frigoris TaxID=205327 RepID=A0ABS6BX26_9CLOT|nr:NAD-dependent dihydropyrimidine dehydrogenase subunit PreA [Clostridium frigoris]MBU3161152.1 NAD-dependent dihydropyrimidine dehydrogenase subunit PreA [Clostridium frigoris]
MRKKDLSIEFCGVKCENPFFLASSPVGNNYEMCAKALETGWGGIVFKTSAMQQMKEVSPRFDANRKEGTPFIGFKNMEQVSEHSVQQNLADMKKLKENYPNKVLVASIMGSNEEEWTKLAQLVTEIGADIIECNFSCPQMTSHSMGCDVGQNPALVKKYSTAVRKGTHLPILAKMTPNIGNMTIPAIAALEGGATGIAAINTIKCITGVDLDKKIGLPIINGKSSVSGYSGKAVKPIALRFINELAKEPKLKNVPISGIGGIETWQDALEFIMLGSSNLQVTTAIMQYGYRIVEDMISGIEYYMDEKGVEKLSDLVGIALDNIVPAENLDRNYIVYPNFDHEKCIGCGRCYISCFDGAHQAIEWDEKSRTPSLNKDNCVGCLLCSLICPIEGCITKGEIKFKDLGVEKDLIL